MEDLWKICARSLQAPRDYYNYRVSCLRLRCVRACVTRREIKVYLGVSLFLLLLLLLLLLVSTPRLFEIGAFLLQFCDFLCQNEEQLNILKQILDGFDFS